MPTIQVGAIRTGDRNPNAGIGPYSACDRLGLINGLFGVDTDRWGFIAMTRSSTLRIT